MYPWRGAWVDGSLEPCLRNSAEEETSSPGGTSSGRPRAVFRHLKSCHWEEGRNELTVGPQGVNCQYQAVEFWTEEIQRDAEDSISNSYLKRDTRGRGQGSWSGRGPSKVPGTSSDYRRQIELRGANGP